MSKPATERIEPFDIFIKGNSNKSYVIYVWSSTTVLDMKVLFHIKSGDELDNMRLFYNGKQLYYDLATVGILGIKRGETLHAINRLVGGGEVRIIPIGCTGTNNPEENISIFGFKNEI